MTEKSIQFLLSTSITIMRFFSTHRFIYFIYIIFFCSFLIFIIDFLFGNFILGIVRSSQESKRAEIASIERNLRVKNPFFHHTLSSNFDGGVYWGDSTYRVCTNQYGMKDSCDKSLQVGKMLDIAIIGDSFAEGIGLTYEESFVGQIASAFPNLKIGNFSAASYSPSIYLTKVKKLLEEGFTFNELIVYIDISDIQDEATSYYINDDKVLDIPKILNIESSDTIDKGLTETNIPQTKNILRKLFPLIYQVAHDVKFHVNRRIKLKGNFEEWVSTRLLVNKDLERGAWTYNDRINGYGKIGIDGAINKSLDTMENLHKLLKQKNIKLSIAVYPWPGQLIYDEERSKQVLIWEKFCENRCNNFLNSYPVFHEYAKNFGTKKAIEDLYNEDDVHFNKIGSLLIAQDFIKTYLNKR